RPERFPHTPAMRLIERRKPDALAFRAIRHHGRLAARTTHRGQTKTCKRPNRMEKFQGLQESRNRMDAANTEPRQESVRYRVGPGERGGMRDRSGARLFRAADLHGHDWLSQFP